MNDKGDFSPRAGLSYRPLGAISTFYTNLADGPIWQDPPRRLYAYATRATAPEDRARRAVNPSQPLKAGDRLRKQYDTVKNI